MEDCTGFERLSSCPRWEVDQLRKKALGLKKELRQQLQKGRNLIEASFDDYIEDEGRLLRATFAGKSEKISQDGWRVEMPTFQVLFLKVSPVADVRLSCKSCTKDTPIHIPHNVSKFIDLQLMGWELKGLSKDFKEPKIRINVKGAMYAERTKSKSVLANNLLLNLYNLAPPKPIDFFAQDFLQPLAEKSSSSSRNSKHIPKKEPRDFTMPYYTRDDEAVDDFDEYDPTPYGGGFDLFLTYGRPLSPSEETCYPHSAGNDDNIDYERPQFESYAEPSAYGDDALQAEYSSYSRPKPHSYGAPSGEQGYGSGGYESSRPQPAYGFQPSGSEYGSEGYRRKPEYGEQEYGSGGYGRKQETESYGSGEYGSGGYRRKQESESYGSEEYVSGGYGGRQESDSYGSGGYGRRQESDSYGSGGYGRRQEEGESEGYRRQSESEEYGSGRKQRYGEEGYEGSGYRREEYERPSYGDEEPRRPSYGRSEEEDYRKPSYERRDEDEGYGRKKYGGDSDEEEKHSRRHHHHHRRNYDDE
ncbi:uncharacterized protein E6C27_scaffold135G001680 [Cucumis melo var. makuwa]|uniref:Uncharacterized protein n=3 Tax=Cucumis melo TaxID=3656 RepID=A0A5A7UCY4_CUCMM|nr:uncharacterized protein E6C27_scaffold135G001680 [Cucumis melo var. makuwa]